MSLPNAPLQDPDAERAAQALSRENSKIALARCITLEDERMRALHREIRKLRRDNERLHKRCREMEGNERISRTAAEHMRWSTSQALRAAASAMESL